MSQLQLDHIDKFFNEGKPNEVRALSDVTLSIEEGDSIAIVGKSGAGKSTLLHILGCLAKPTNGTYFLDKQEVFFHDQKKLAFLRNKMFGTVLQEFGLIEYRNVLDNISVPLLFNKEISHKEVHKLCCQALAKVDMSTLSKRDTWSLSGGQKQRIAIARALVNQPKILLADEPTGALDFYNTRIIMDIFKKLNQEGITVIIVTHDLDIAKQCKRMVTVSDGHLIEE